MYLRTFERIRDANWIGNQSIFAELIYTGLEAVVPNLSRWSRYATDLSEKKPHGAVIHENLSMVRSRSMS
jgi:hypothetical protein